jgi:hypothetical protein
MCLKVNKCSKLPTSYQRAQNFEKFLNIIADTKYRTRKFWDEIAHRNIPYKYFKITAVSFAQ